MSGYHFGTIVRDYITDYIKFADTKAGAVIALLTLVAGALGASADRIVEVLTAGPVALRWLGLLSITATLIATFCSIWSALNALHPRSNSAEGSLASFPDIAKLDSDTYGRRITASNEDALAQELAKLNVTLSQIARQKFSSIEWATMWLRYALLAGYVFLIVYASSALVQ